MELGALARQADPDAAKLFITKRGTVRNSTAGIASLAKVVAKYCGKVLEKPKERTSNWEAPLTERQLACRYSSVSRKIRIHRLFRRRGK